MNYEEKYKEALERAKSFELPEYKNIMVSIFPELAEGEDERIRKKLIDLIYKVYTNTNYLTCKEHERFLSWLEKQGEKDKLIADKDKL